MTDELETTDERSTPEAGDGEGASTPMVDALSAAAEVHDLADMAAEVTLEIGRAHV